MHNTLPSTQRYLTHYLSHTHITHWDLTFSLPEGLVVSFACLTPPIKVSILSFENRVLFAEEFFTQRYLTHYLSHTHITHWDLTFSLPEGLVVSFACLTPPIKVSILSFENRVLFAEEFFVDISRISLQNLSWVSTCILTLYYYESKYIAF